MFTNRQSKLLERLTNPDAEAAKAPHVSELAEALSNAFGGPDALAEMLRELVSDPKTPSWLKTRAYGIVTSTIWNASKLAEEKPKNEFIGADQAQLKAVAAILLREILGVTDEMEADLKTVVAAWPELPAETRESIVTMAKAVSAIG